MSNEKKVEVFTSILTVADNKPLRVLPNPIVRFWIDKHRYFDVRMDEGGIEIRNGGGMVFSPRSSNDILIVPKR